MATTGKGSLYRWPRTPPGARAPARGRPLRAGTAGLADGSLTRLGQVAPQLLETIQRDVKATAKGASRSSGSRQGLARCGGQAAGQGREAQAAGRRGTAEVAGPADAELRLSPENDETALASAVS